MSGVFFHNTFAARKEILTKVFIFSIRLAISSSYINKDHRKKNIFYIYTDSFFICWISCSWWNRIVWESFDFFLFELESWLCGFFWIKFSLNGGFFGRYFGGFSARKLVFKSIGKSTQGRWIELLKVERGKGG